MLIEQAGNFNAFRSRRVTFSDTFARPDSGSLGSNWTDSFGTGTQIVSEQLRGDGTVASAHVNVPVGSHDYWVECVIAQTGGNASFYFRADAPVPTNQYHCYLDSGTLYLRRASPSATLVSAAINATTDTLVRCEVRGIDIKIWAFRGTSAMAVNARPTLAYVDQTAPIVKGQYVGVRCDATTDRIESIAFGPL